MISQDPFILLSIINTKLRDMYSSLDLLCDDLGESREEIENMLEKIGYKYNISQNRFEQQ